MKARVAVAAFLALFVTSSIQGQSGFAGKWRWRGTGGWQEMTLELRVDGAAPSGVITLGPSSRAQEALPQEDYWRYFFESATFRIAHAKIDGNTITFDHVVNKDDATLEQTLKYTGKLAGDTIQFTRETQGKEAALWVVGTHRAEFRMERIP